LNYYTIPISRVKFAGSSTATDGLINGAVTLTENAYWTAELTFENATLIYPSVADSGTSVLVEVQDASVGGSWTTIFSGTVLFPNLNFDGSSANVTFQCVGLGYALNMMNCAEEYGTQTKYPGNYTINTILNDVTVGIIPKWVNKYRGTANDSGYSITTTNIDSLAGTIPYISFPWKPVDKCIDDLCDLTTALVSGSHAGPHWICDNSGNLRVKRIDYSQTGWTKYYGNSQANATLVNGEDFFNGDFQKVGKQANVVFYYGNWRRPSNGDVWTENNHADWGADGGGITYSDESTIKLVGEKSIHCYNSYGTGCGFTFTFPEPLDLTYFTDDNRPSLLFDLAVAYVPVTQATGSGIYNYFFARLESSTGNYIYNRPGESSISKATTSSDINFQHFNLPISLNSTGSWYKVGTPDLTNLTKVEIWVPNQENVYLDGFHFGGAAIARIARQCFPTGDPSVGTLGTTTNPIRFKVFTDNIGKDDSLIDSDDSGLLAQMAKAQLLKLNSTPVNGKFSTPLIPDVLPGQYFYIGGDWRITKVTHNITTMQSIFEVTDDLYNSHPRLRYEDINKVSAAIRPEFQDNQSSSIKMGTCDIRVLPLEKAYNI
jgi:hypothetical protein